MGQQGETEVDSKTAVHHDGCVEKSQKNSLIVELNLLVKSLLHYLIHSQVGHDLRIRNPNQPPAKMSLY